MMKKFQDLKIVEIDEENSQRAEPGGALYTIVLTLSSSAPGEWADYFNQNWEHRIYMMKRKASVYGNRLSIYCIPEELEKYHIPELKSAIEEANKAYREYLSAQEVEMQKLEKSKKEEKSTLAGLKKQIKFD